MIKKSFICPTRFIRDFQSQGDFILALSHLIDLDIELDYEREILATGLPIMLDNGLFENHTPEPIESLIKKALKIGATHFFAPDVLFDHKGTLKELNRAISLAQGTLLKVGAVVQADDWQDYIAELIAINDIEGVDLIGLSILSIPKSWEKKLEKFDVSKSRVELLKEMVKLSKKGVVWKPCHLLGLGDNYSDLEYASKNCPWVVSNDSSSTFQTGLFGKTYTKTLKVPGGKIQEKVDFGLREITDKQYKLIQENINKIIKI